MFFNRLKRRRELLEKKERQIRSIRGHNKRRVREATKPIQELTRRFEENGISLEIADAIRGHHG